MRRFCVWLFSLSLRLLGADGRGVWTSFCARLGGFLGHGGRREGSFGNLRLKGGSLVEVLASLSIASLVFVLAATVFLQLGGKASVRQQQRFQLLSSAMLSEVEFEKKLRDDIAILDGYTVQKKVSKLNWRSKLYEVEIVISNQEKDVVFKRSKVVHVL